MLHSSRFHGGWVGARGVMGKVNLVQQECGPNWVEDNLMAGGTSLELSGDNDGGSGGGLDSKLDSTGDSSLTGGPTG